MKPVFDYVVYFIVRILICGLQAMPLKMLAPICDQIGWVCWNVLRFRRQVVEENLLIAFPVKSQGERENIALAMWQHLFLMIAEIAHAPRKLHRSNWRQHSSFTNMRAAIAALIDDRPSVIISGHLGNFELGGYLLALHGFPTHTIARPLDNPYLDRFVNEFRGSKGQYMLPKHGSGPQIAEVLDQGGTLVLLGDQFASTAGCWVEFFGRPASTHKAVAVFSLGSKARTLVSAAVRRGGPLCIKMDITGIVDPAEKDFPLGTIPLLTEWYTKNLEKLVRDAPDQYWWVHRRWRGSPDDRQNRRLLRKQQAA
jgi:KDO2-lipid IV(A) lauroyltransferase